MEKSYTYAIFDSKQKAHDAIDALSDEFQTRKIDVMLQDPATDEPVQEIPIRMKTSVAPGVAVGAVFGAIVVTMVALSTSMFASQPIIAAIQGIVAGAFVGGLVGAVGGLGHWDSAPAMPDDFDGRSKILVGISTGGGRLDTAQSKLREQGAEDIAILAHTPDRHLRSA